MYSSCPGVAGKKKKKKKKKHEGNFVWKYYEQSRV